MAKKNKATENGAEVTNIAIDEPINEQAEKMMSGIMTLAMREQHFISSADKISEKLTEEHITQIIDLGAKDDLRAFTAFKWKTVTTMLVFIASLFFAGFMLVFFRDSAHFQTILTAIFSFLGGLGVGRYIKGTN